MTRSAIVNCLQLTKRLLERRLMRVCLIDGSGGGGGAEHLATGGGGAGFATRTELRGTEQHSAFYGNRMFITAFTIARHIQQETG